jgi:hypothetical protein
MCISYRVKFYCIRSRLENIHLAILYFFLLICHFADSSELLLQILPDGIKYTYGMVWNRDGEKSNEKNEKRVTKEMKEQ